jgi:hypothetical protein
MAITEQSRLGAFKTRKTRILEVLIDETFNWNVQ